MPVPRNAWKLPIDIVTGDLATAKLHLAHCIW